MVNKNDANREQGVIPHLVVDDAAAALEFYKKALGATETMRLPADDGKRIMHAEIEVNGAKIFVRDDFPEHCAEHGAGKPSTPNALGGTPVTLHLDVADCDAAVKCAAAAGLTTHQFSHAAHRGGGGTRRCRQAWSRRMPRLNRDIRLRRRLRGWRAGAFFLGRQS